MQYKKVSYSLDAEFKIEESIEMHWDYTQRNVQSD